ncbi:aminodeoxychorismate synthase component I [Prauserella muralis]|uniref:Aminodeoxychorismate synthase, component I n=1 Tax=Prauserella muralis TaxID=588067 RepID=A0A2V4AMM7_9PSEU|nr:aminodeoxychorismate synthase component I [Prauserella muralis]PXY21467.1 aminodeoxychorismate synthase, component I [Prauserella muralis]TWE30410.1 para-aminobenzoate synthetase component 1 [Prauserella muralis]
MRLARRFLRSGPAPERVLLALDRRARRLGLAPPAALCGTWFGSRAVLAPSVPVTPVPDAGEAFAVPARQPEVRNAAPGAVGGGWFGYLSYDLTDPSGRGAALPSAAWGWADHVLRLDADGDWWFEALVPDGEPEPVALAAELGAVLGEERAVPAWPAAELARPLPSEHHAAVKACVHAIEAGELFQANICARFSGRFAGEPGTLFAEGVRRLGPARGAYLAGDWGALVSMSPELFLSRTGRRVRSTPIKGTLPRRDAGDDHLARRLRESVKDVAENVMITDLVRNDLGRVCETGSVRVPELLAVRAAPGVWHLDSTVEGTLAPGRDDADLLRATFPPGSVTGAPKLRALDLIAELEGAPRGVYTGALGLASPVAGLELSVAIRTFELHGGTVELGVGGGITADSDAAAEWQEALHKAAPLERLLREPPGA